MELLVVIAIIIVLAGISVPAYNSIRQKSLNTACVNNLRAIGIGLESYLADHNNVMPNLNMEQSEDPGSGEPAPVLQTALLEYVGGDPEIFHCPADKEEFAKTGSSYFWNPLLNGQSQLNLQFMGNSDDLSAIPLVSDKEAFHGTRNGTNILYGDYSTADKVRLSVGPPSPNP